MSNYRQPTSRLGSGTRIIAVCIAILCLTPAAAEDAFDVNWYGYVKMDFMYDIDQDLGPTLDATQLNTSATSDDPNFRAHARQTRLGLKAKYNDVTLTVEGDFFGSGGNEVVSNSYGLRLRHAYGQWGNWTIGQTWSTFMDFAALPPTVEFDGPGGTAFARQELLRYSFGNLSLAIENPEQILRAPEGVSTSEKFPDLIAKYSASGESGSIYAAGVLQSTEILGGLADGETVTQFGVHVGGNIKFGDSTIMLSGLANAGRYGFYGFANPTVIVDGASAEANEYTAVVAAYQYQGFTVAYGRVAHDDELLSVGDVDTITTWHANYMFSPRKNLTLMAEVSNAKKEDIGGADASNTRLQFAAQYNF